MQKEYKKCVVEFFPLTLLKRFYQLNHLLQQWQLYNWLAYKKPPYINESIIKYAKLIQNETTKNIKFYQNGCINFPIIL